MEINKTTYNYIAEDWFRDHQSDTWWQEGTNTFITYLPKDGSVLDLGCGGGVKSKYLIEQGLRVVGIDFSEQMIAIAKREVPQGIFHVMDIRDASGLKEQFDGIFTQAVLLHIPRGEAFSVLKGLMKTLKPGGYFYCAVKEKKEGKPDEEIKTEHDYGYMYQRFFSYFSLDEILGFMQELGLEVVWKEITPSGNTRWIQIIARK